MLRHSVTALALLAAVASTCPAASAQVLDGFTWVNQKTDTATMQSVAHILAGVDYTSIVEVAYLASPPTTSANGAESTATPGPAPVASALLRRDVHMLAIVARLPGATALPGDRCFLRTT